jgi:hypothetical protein
MFMPFTAQHGGTARHENLFQERRSDTKVGSNINATPIFRSCQSIHELGPNLANQKALQPGPDQEQAEKRQNAAGTYENAEKDDNHLSVMNYNPTRDRIDSGIAGRKLPARAVMQVYDDLDVSPMVFGQISPYF